MLGWINLIAIIIIPIAAVCIGQYLQECSEKRKDKKQAFETLMADRDGTWSMASVNVLNTIDVIFEDESIVLDKWRQYYQKLCVQSPTEEQLQEINEAKFQLLTAMANCLGYKDKITSETIQNTYLPNWVVERSAKQQRYEDNQLAAMEAINRMLSGNNVPGNVPNGQNENGSSKDAIQEQ